MRYLVEWNDGKEREGEKWMFRVGVKDDRCAIAAGPAKRALFPRRP